MKKEKGNTGRIVRRGGFSRVEVAAILGVAGATAALVMPAQANIFDWLFGRARGNASRNTCQSNLKQLGLGLMQYHLDYDEKAAPATSKSEYYGWANLIQPYVKSRQLFQCPDEKNVQEPDAEVPADSFKQKGFTDYWYSSRMSGRPLDEIASNTQTLTMGDGDGGSALSTARYNIGALPKSWVETKGSPARRHITNGVEGANYAFADGHVKWFAPGKISTQTLAQAGGNPTFSLK